MQNIERFENGNISYIENIEVISPFWQGLYPNRRISDDGTLWIRTGKNQKFNADGSIRWEIEYDEFGEIVKKQNL